MFEGQELEPDSLPPPVPPSLFSLAGILASIGQCLQKQREKRARQAAEFYDNSMLIHRETMVWYTIACTEIAGRY